MMKPLRCRLVINISHTNPLPIQFSDLPKIPRNLIMFAPSPYSLARERDIQIEFYPLQHAMWVSLRTADTDYILIRPDLTERQTHYTIAHELAHFMHDRRTSPPRRASRGQDSTWGADTARQAPRGDWGRIHRVQRPRVSVWGGWGGGGEASTWYFQLYDSFVRFTIEAERSFRWVQQNDGYKIYHRFTTFHTTLIPLNLCTTRPTISVSSATSANPPMTPSTKKPA